MYALVFFIAKSTSSVVKRSIVSDDAETDEEEKITFSKKSHIVRILAFHGKLIIPLSPRHLP